MEQQAGFTIDPGIKLVLILVGSAILASIIIGLLVGRYLRKRKEPDYHPVLSRKEAIICGSSVLLGAVVIVVGLFVPKLFNKDAVETDMSGEGSSVSGEGEINGEGAIDESVVVDSGGGGSNTVTVPSGGGVVIMEAR